LNSGANDLRVRGFFRSMVSMMDILPEASPLMWDVRQTGSGPTLQLGRSKTYELTVEWDRSGGAQGLPFVRFGTQKRIPRAALVQFIESVLKPVS